MKTEPTKYTLSAEIVCLLLLIISSILLCVYWNAIPDKVAMHYDFSGNITRYGSKVEILIMPAAAWFAYALMSVIAHYPQLWNTGVEITETNRERVYQTLKAMLVTLKLVVCTLFISYIPIIALQIPLPGWWIFVIVGIVFLILGGFLFRLYQIK